MMIEPEQVAALKATLSSPALRLSVEIKQSLDICEKFVESLLTFVQANNAALSGKDYGFLLERKQNYSSSPVLDPRAVAQEISQGNNLFYVDINLRLGRVAKVRDRAALSQLSATETTYAAFISPPNVMQLLNGTILHEQDIRYPALGPAKSVVNAHPMDMFATIVDEHFSECVLNEKQVRYWQDKRKRVLKANAPDGTEMLFHQSLFWWLNRCISDSIAVYAEPNMTGLDKTDIVVVNENGQHLVEVKWLGENENSTSYDKGQIDAGVKQVGLYLTRDNKIVRGYLVIYDGRVLKKHQDESGHSASLHTRCAPPIIKFLENETPSVAAKKQSAP